MSKKKKITRKKHVPQRTCVGCREVGPKMTMVRIVNSPDGVQIDPKGKLAGRGAYLHKRETCWKQASVSRLSKALHTDLTDQDIERLRTYFEEDQNSEAEQINGQ